MTTQAMIQNLIKTGEFVIVPRDFFEDLISKKNKKANPPEVPNKILAKAIQEARRDRKTGKNSYGPFTLKQSEAFLKTL